MKAILILDEMPKSCMDCCLTDGEWAKCVVEWRDEEYDKRPSWCPLKKMPERKRLPHETDDDDILFGKACGWNACIEEIEK